MYTVKPGWLPTPTTERGGLMADVPLLESGPAGWEGGLRAVRHHLPRTAIQGSPARLALISR